VTAALASASSPTEVVTNPTPAVSATMTLSDIGGCPVWTVQGKVKPAYRGHGANVRLVCMQYNALTSGAPFLVYPNCDGDFCPNVNVDACGNFSFQIVNACGTETQLDNSYFCTFVVHVDDSKSPQSCGNGKSANLDAVQDPNGSAPCSGGYCPVAP
jgi:hypothetical protein